MIKVKMLDRFLLFAPSIKNYNNTPLKIQKFIKLVDKSTNEATNE